MLVDTWGIPDGETDLMLEDRKQLHAALPSLSRDQRMQLGRIDRQAETLLVAHRHSEDPCGDLHLLAQIVDLIHSEQSAHAA